MPAENNKGRKPLGIVEYLMAELRQAFQDIRQKVAEEGWFGRVVTAAPVVEMDRAQIEGSREPGITFGPSTAETGVASFDELWAPRERDAPREVDQTHDMGIDR
jgi:hypothetical protein